MNEISSKTAEVAELPRFRHKLNLQMFAGEDEGYPSLEDSQEFNDDAREFNAKMDKFMSDRTPKEETPAATEIENEPVKVEEAEKPEVVDPEKPKQDSETNRAFQELRKAREEAERTAKENADKLRRADEFVAQNWGHMGITTVEQYEAALKAEREAENKQRYNEAGLTPEEIEAIQNYPSLKQKDAQQQTEQSKAEKDAAWGKFYTIYPELAESSLVFDAGGKPEWFTPEMEAEIARGASPLAAYRNAHFETILQKTVGNTKEVAKQEALNSLNSKNHLKPNGTETADVEHVEIDEETMRMYRSLNKGKSDAEIRKWHKKYAMGG